MERKRFLEEEEDMRGDENSGIPRKRAHVADIKSDKKKKAAKSNGKKTAKKKKAKKILKPKKAS